MWSVVASALAARRRQAIVIGLVTLLASTALAVAPRYVAGAVEGVAEAAVAGTSVDDRVVVISERQGRGESYDPDLLAPARQSFAPSGFVAVSGAFAEVDLDETVWGPLMRAELAYREEMCDALLITGGCPTAAGEVLLPAGPAAAAGLDVGDEVTLFPRSIDPRTLRVVGLYQVQDPADPFWGDGNLLNVDDPSQIALFTPQETLVDYERVTHTYELVATPEAFRGVQAEQIRNDLEVRLDEVRRFGFSVAEGQLDLLIERIERDRGELWAGVGVGVAVLLLFTWFTLAVALRGAVAAQRADVGWWRLHGVPSVRGVVALLAQGLVPLFAGAVAGAVVGFAAGGWFPVADADARRDAATLALVFVGLAVAGGLVVVVATQLRTLRTPVNDLIRRVQGRPRRWRRTVVDLVLVLVSAAAVAQALTVGREARGLTQLAPALVTLGVAVIAAWALLPFVVSLGGRALRSGRLAGVLVAVSVTRRDSAQRMFVVLAVAVGLVTTALVGWATDVRAQAERAAHEAGADRVIRVAPVTPTQLLAAVRSVDPTGEFAMAVVRHSPMGPQPWLYAVDSSRLGVVANWREEYGGSLEQVAAALRPVELEPVTVASDRIVVTATGVDPWGGEVYLRLNWYTVDTGRSVTTTVGPLTEEPREHAAELAACRVGCRLASFDVMGRPTTDDAAQGGYVPAGDETEVELIALADGEGNPVAPDVIIDPTRWRSSTSPNALGPVVTAGERGLRVRLPTFIPGLGEPLFRADRVSFMDAPLPIPVVSANWERDPLTEPQLTPLSGEPLPATEVTTASLVPRGRGEGVLVDLEYADRLRDDGSVVTGAEVWLSASAPVTIVDELHGAGLTPVNETSLSQHRERLAAQGNAVAARFQIMVALICLLLAGGVVVVLSVQEQAGRARELAALRVQGLKAGVIRAASYGAVLTVAGAATVVGLGAGVAGAAIGRSLQRGFVDGWRLLPPPPLQSYPVAVAAAGAVLVLGVAGIAAAVSLLRRVRRLP